MDYDIVIGLEVHAELKTRSKCFCSCANEFSTMPNSNCCEVCIGLPGALPVLNKQAVQYTIRAGIATNCKINNTAIFERKNYFYPDLSKAYQISQLEKPICIEGNLTLKNGRTIRINRIHLEEDAGKLVHEGGYTLIDYNRGGVPLIELVTEPDIQSADEAIEFIEKLRLLYIYSGIADCKMEEGQMRADVNISLKPKGATEFGTKTEMKNISGLKAIHRAIEYEIERQRVELSYGNNIIQQTLRWDDELGENYPLRDKENSNDYRYFPDPDLPNIEITDKQIKSVKNTMPMLPDELREIYLKDYGLNEYDTDVILANVDIAKFFEDCMKDYNNPKNLSNWITTEIMSRIKESDGKILISKDNLLWIIKAVDEKKVQRVPAKDLMSKIWGTDLNAEVQAKQDNIICDISDNFVMNLISLVLTEKADVVEQYKKEKDEKIINFLVGQVMRKSKGKANANLVMETIKEKVKDQK